jgi:hypothetical protein
MHGLGLVVLLIWLWRWRKSVSPSKNVIPPQISTVFLKFVVLMIAGAFAADAGYFGAALWSVAAILIWTPTLVLEWIVLPLHMPRVAYWVARVGYPLGFIGESSAGCVIYGALAAERTQSRLKFAVWLKERLDQPRRLRGGGVVAAGLLATLRGDRDRARCLFLVADTLPSQVISRKARRIARDWLVAEAAQAEEWREVIRLGRDKSDSHRWSYLMARIAERLVGDRRACANWLLWLLWLIAPRRLSTLPQLRRALSMPRASIEIPQRRQLPSELPQALAALAQTLTMQTQDCASVCESVRAVNHALNAMTTRSWIEARIVALGAKGDVDAIVGRARQRTVDLLVPLLESSPHLAPKDDREPILAEAVARVRSRYFKDIEAQCNDYRERTKSKETLDRVLEWELWAVLRCSADRLLMLDPASEASLFQAMWPVCNNFAALQHNERHRLMFAYEIYSWLYKHAQSTPSALRLLAQNMRASRT